MKVQLAALILCILVFTSGCATYMVTHELERPISPGTCKVVAIQSALPATQDEEDLPREQEISKLLTTLEDAVRKTGLFTAVEPFLDTSTYVVKATIITFKRGSGAVRALIGFGVGNAKITVEIKLIERNSDAVLFSGNFSQEISDWTEAGDKMYGKIARDFGMALKKRADALSKST